MWWLHCHLEMRSHALQMSVQAPRHAVLWDGTIASVTINFSVASAFPVGADAFFLESSSKRLLENGHAAAELHVLDEAVAELTGTETELLPPLQLARSAYSMLAPQHTFDRGRLLTGVWRDIATQMLPFVHPTVKDGSGEGKGLGRVALLLTGPSRSGKALEAHAAGAALGISVLDIDCASAVGVGGNPYDDAECVNLLESIFTQVCLDGVF
jgi:hypothetical protein